MELLREYLVVWMEREARELEKLVSERGEPDLVYTDFFSQGIIGSALKMEILIAQSDPNPVGLTHQNKPYLPSTSTYQSFQQSQLFTSRFSKSITKFLWLLPDIVRLVSGVESKRHSVMLPKAGSIFYNSPRILHIHPDMLFTFPRPLPPNVRLVGFVQNPINESFPLQGDLEKFISNQNHIFYAAFGSHFYLEGRLLARIINDFEQLLSSNHSIIFAVNNATVVQYVRKELKHYSNIFVIQWVNQKKVLAHPKVKIFFSHGGLSSLAGNFKLNFFFSLVCSQTGKNKESILAHKPIVILPLGAEQLFTAPAAKYQRVAEIYNFYDDKSKDLPSLVHKILSDYPSFVKRCENAANLNRAIGGAQRAAEEVEAFISFPSAFADVEYDMFFVARYNFDVIAIIVAFSLLIFRIFVSIYSFCCRPKKVKRE